MADETATHESARKRAHKEKGPSAFLAAARQALTTALPELIPARWALKGNKSLRAVFFPATKQLEDAGFIAQLWIGRQEGGDIRCSFEVVKTTAGNGNNDQRETIAQSLRVHLSGQVLPESVQLSAKSTAARLKLKVDVSEDTKENVSFYQNEIDKIVRFVEFLDTALSDWSPSENSGSPTNETPMLFLRVGWMRDYRGLSGDKIDGGGKFVQKHGYGHEIFNFLPCEGRVFGYVRPKSNKGEKSDGSGIRLERLGGAEKRW